MSYRIRLAMSVLWFAAACSFPRPADVPEPITCTANDFLKCDGNSLQTCNATGHGADAQDCGVAGCNADAKRCNQCVPNSSTCGVNPSELDHCGADGLPVGQETCALACTSSPTAHCAYLEPRYMPDVCDAPATLPELNITRSVNFDTGLDGNCTGGVIHQEGAAEICVVRYGTIEIGTGATLTASGARALALVADHALSVDGTLDVASHGSIAGPGGGLTSGTALTSSTGGGGAGFATVGGNGGSLTMDGGGGAGGSPITNPSLLAVLIGGGTAPRAAGLGPPLAGGGGGSATLIACRGTVTVNGTLSAGGGGGGGGRAGVVAGQVYSGGSGGSGGNVVLQGLSIVVTGSAYANGGGGGAGYPGNGTDGAPGFSGEELPTFSPGGASSSGEGAGGAGGWRDAGPTAGKAPTQAGALPGGGGGSVGFFQSYTPATITPTITPIAASPAFSANRHTNTR